MNATPGMFEQLTTALGIAVLHSLWQCALIGSVAALLMLMLRGANKRYVVWCVSMLLCAAWMVLTFVGAMWPQASGDGTPGVIRAGLLGVMPTAVPETRTMLFEVVAWLWAGGFVFFTVRFAQQWVAARRMRTHGVVDAAQCWLDLFDEVRTGLGVSRRVALLVSTRAHSPMVVGWLSPVVIVPLSALTTQSPEQVRLVLVHELAHIRRYDHVVNMLQVLIETVLFYHPVVWWMSHQARLEREHCCDDAAVRWGGDAVAFARALTELETTRTRSRAVLALNHGGSLMKRVTRILGTSDRHQLGNGSLRTLAALTAGTVVAAAGIANAAMRASEPRYEQPEVVEDNLDSSVMLDEQAWREILLEVAVPGMINAGKLDQHVQSALLKIEDAVSKGAITAQEGEARRAALNDDVDFRLRMNFKTKVTGMTVEEAQQAIMQERREAEIKDGEIGAADDDEYTRLDLSPNGSTINGTPVRMIEGDWIYGTYEVLEDSPDGVYKAGDTFVVTEPLSGGAIQMFDGGDEREGASGDGLILPGVEEEVLEARQKQELGVFNVYKRNLASGYFQELHKELDSGHMTKDEVDERVEEALRRERFVARWLSIDLMYQDQVSAGKLSVEEANTLLSEARKANGYFDSPYGSEFTFEVVQPGKVFEITVETAPGSDAPAGQPVELDLQVEPVETQRKLTPMDEEYWHHQGIRPLSAYDDSVDGC